MPQPWEHHMVFTAPPVLQHCAKADKSLGARCENPLFIKCVCQWCSLCSGMPLAGTGHARGLKGQETEAAQCVFIVQSSICQQMHLFYNKVMNFAQKESVVDSQSSWRLTASLDGFWLLWQSQSSLRCRNPSVFWEPSRWLCPNRGGLVPSPWAAQAQLVTNSPSLALSARHGPLQPRNDFVSHQEVDLNQKQPIPGIPEYPELEGPRRIIESSSSHCTWPPRGSPWCLRGNEHCNLWLLFSSVANEESLNFSLLHGLHYNF